MRIAYFGSPQHLNIYKHRRQSYEDALREQDLTVEADLLIICDMKIEDGVSGMQQLLALPQLPDAIFSASDLTMIGALGVLKEQGLCVPKDVGLMGFRNELFSRLTEPKRTSVDQHCELMGQTASQLLLEIRHAQCQPFAHGHVVNQPNLLVRASSMR